MKEAEATRCAHARWDPSCDCDWCEEMDVPCTGSMDDVAFWPSEMDCFEPICLWEIYRANPSYENMTRWLKHRAYNRVTGWCQE